MTRVFISPEHVSVTEAAKIVKKPRYDKNLRKIKYLNFLTIN